MLWYGMVCYVMLWYECLVYNEHFFFFFTKASIIIGSNISKLEATVHVEEAGEVRRARGESTVIFFR
jgi:hypothetical protein